MDDDDDIEKTAALENEVIALMQTLVTEHDYIESDLLALVHSAVTTA